MNRVVRALICLVAVGLPLSASAALQQPVPQPYPKVVQPQGPPPAKPTPPPTAQAAPAPTTPQDVGKATEPNEASLGVPIYPNSKFITSYDAGKGQRFFLFGTTGSFADVVAYYKSVLKQKGELVFDEPATHQFDLGRFREETMGFPPSVTVKDYTWNGMKGLPNPKLGAEPARYLTVIQIVPIPDGTAR